MNELHDVVKIQVDKRPFTMLHCRHFTAGGQRPIHTITFGGLHNVNE